MSLEIRLSKDIGDALRAHDQTRLVAVRMLKAALMNRAVERGRALTEAEEQQVVASLVKQRRESIEQFVKGGRQELADKEAAEIIVLEAFLPPPVGADELDAAVRAAIAETGASSPKDMGKVMKAVMATLEGRHADGKAVSDLVRQRLAG